jgi:hypothetical protein
VECATGMRATICVSTQRIGGEVCSAAATFKDPKRQILTKWVKILLDGGQDEGGERRPYNELMMRCEKFVTDTCCQG